MKSAMAENDRLAHAEGVGITEKARTLETEMLLHCGSRWRAQLTAMVATVPTTRAGLAAQALLLIHMETEWGDLGQILTDEDWLTFAKTVHLAALQMEAAR